VQDRVIETLLWPASRLRQKGLQVPGGDTPPDLIPSDPDDTDYNEFAEDNNREVDERVYQRIVRRGRALISRDSSDADEDEEDGEGSQYDKAGDEEVEEDEGDEEDDGDEEDEGDEEEDEEDEEDE